MLKGSASVLRSRGFFGPPATNQAKKTPEHLLQAVQLFLMAERHEGARDGALVAAQPCGEITRPQSQPANHERFLAHLVCAAEHLPQRMVSDEVVPPAKVESRPHLPRIGRSHHAMMEAGLFGERAGLPTLHARRGGGNGVNGPPAHRNVSADFFEARPPEHLARSGNMVAAHEAIVVNLALRVEEG